MLNQSGKTNIIKKVALLFSDLIEPKVTEFGRIYSSHMQYLQKLKLETLMVLELKLEKIIQLKLISGLTTQHQLSLKNTENGF
jgi:hypothetical protein